jgi:hypothetical protein
MRELTRRDALAGAAALGAVGLAGCVSENNDDNGDDGEDNPDNTDNPENANDPDSSSSEDNGGDDGSNPEAQQGSELELLDTELTTANTECGSGDMVEATITNGDLELAGKMPASNPCHDAVLDDATLEDGVLSVAVGVEDATSEDEGCVQCLGVVDYEGTLAFSEDLSDLSAFESVTVEHGGTSGQTHTVRETGVVSGSVSGEDGRSDDRDDADGDESDADGDGLESAVLANSIATTDRSCTGNIPPGDEPERVDADDRTEFSQTDNTVTVEGTLTASTPCHEAYTESVSYDGGVLSLVVGVESNLADDEYCTECLAEIQYEATVEVAEQTTVDDVSVTHIQAGS